MPHEEAAEAAGCPAGTIRSRVARARATLVEILADAEEARVPVSATQVTPPARRRSRRSGPRSGS
ncbi:hypothetical protein [Streptomyces sp. NPDC051636]|uniref:hypothetical protein n=1 Tax=Streptomyces sp. NPDC051636 TaxID=3365663 RepID=UPI00379FF744